MAPTPAASVPRPHTDQSLPGLSAIIIWELIALADPNSEYSKSIWESVGTRLLPPYPEPRPPSVPETQIQVMHRVSADRRRGAGAGYPRRLTSGCPSGGQWLGRDLGPSCQEHRGSLYLLMAGGRRVQRGCFPAEASVLEGEAGTALLPCGLRRPAIAGLQACLKKSAHQSSRFTEDELASPASCLEGCPDTAPRGACAGLRGTHDCLGLVGVHRGETESGE